MPKPKTTVKKVNVRLSEKAWKNLDPKGNRSKQIRDALEKISEQEVQIAINECPRYCGVDRENPNLVACKDEEGKGKSYYPKIECQAHKFHHDNLVTIKAVKSLKEDLEKLEKDVSKAKPMRDGLLKEISQLKQEYQAVNVPALLKEKTEEIATLQTDKVAMKALLKEKTEENATLQTDYEQLREQIQHSKIERNVEHRDEVMEKPPYIEKTFEKTVEKIVFKDRSEIVPPAAVIVEKVPCPASAKNIGEPEITKEECIQIRKYHPYLCKSVQCSQFRLKPLCLTALKNTTQ